jgi:hypothetical protein
VALTRTVFIPAAGRGSRLADAGIGLPKPLLSFAGLPVVAQIIDQYPLEWTIVIALGHAGDLVRESIESVYQDSPRLERIRFGYTDSHEHHGKGLTNTILDLRSVIGEEPFVFHACDSLVGESDSCWLEWIEPRDQVLVARPESPGRYRYLQSDDEGEHRWIYDWVDSDSSSVRVYIGVSHIFDTATFWAKLLESAPASPEGGECLGLDPVSVGQVAIGPGRWMDTGSVDGCRRLGAMQFGETNILQKADESIWFTGANVVKMHMDPQFIDGRVKRAHALSPFVPVIKSFGRHTYSYSYVSGDTLSKRLQKTGSSMSAFLSFLLHFWFDADLPRSQDTHRAQDKGRYLEFYRDKTFSRTQSLTGRYPMFAQPTKINGIATPALSAQLESVDWERLTAPLIGRVHGDLHPENVVLTYQGEFLLLDWRQEVAGSRGAFGDVYYDLGKLAHGLRVDHGVVSRGQYCVSRTGPAEVQYTIASTPGKVEAYEALRLFCEQQGFDWSRVLLIEALIYLNIAVLHEPTEYQELLAYMGRDLLNAVSVPASRSEYELGGS